MGFVFILFIIGVIVYGCTSKNDNTTTLYCDMGYEKTTTEELNEEWEYWKKKCAHKADRFLQCYKKIENAFDEDSPDVSAILSAKVESIQLLQWLYETSYEILRYSYSYKRISDYLGSNFRPFMRTNSEYKEEIEWMTEYAMIGKKRKEICSEILTLLSKGDLMRSKIVRMRLCDATPAQISSCCKYLLSKNKIKEYKNEEKNRYFYHIL